MLLEKKTFFYYLIFGPITLFLKHILIRFGILSITFWISSVVIVSYFRTKSPVRAPVTTKCHYKLSRLYLVVFSAKPTCFNWVIKGSTSYSTGLFWSKMENLLFLCISEDISMKKQYLKNK
jgi:hypothetical protein